MPRTPSLSVAFPRQDSQAGNGSPRSPDLTDSGVEGVEEFYKRPQLLAPESPASPRASRSFFGYRTGKQNKGKERAPSTPSSSLTTPTTSQPSYQISPETATANLSHGNLMDTLSTSDGSGQEATATSDVGSAETDTTPKASEINLLNERRPSKHVFQNIMSRSRSVRTEATSPKPATKTASKGRFLEPIPREEHFQTSPRTAPLDQERGYRDAMAGTHRGKSADRSGPSKGDLKPSSYNENSNMMSSIKNTSSSAASGLGRASKGFFSKLTRSGSNNDKDVLMVPDDYVFKVINLPLIEQTKRTRICRTMSEARDKTEYWMPALPYRCIDYLNLKGVEEEGLYRIPGSGREVKYWQTRFDTELDINLLDETELYDINIIGSMLKAWLREVPGELFPKAMQARVNTECAGATEAPQLLKDLLSQLPPYNYYLLFAITCHIALLHSHAAKNKMNYHNLCICFQPSLGIDGHCFYFLVCEWRTCWQGCWTEKEYLAAEQRGVNLVPEPPFQALARTAQSQTPSTPKPNSSAGQSMTSTNVSSVRQDMDALSLTSTSRPATGGQGSSTGATERRRPSPISTHEEGEWEKASSSAKPLGVSSPSTPPSLSPVAQVSPMRL